MVYHRCLVGREGYEGFLVLPWSLSHMVVTPLRGNPFYLFGGEISAIMSENVSIEPGLVLEAVHPVKVEVDIAEKRKAVGICTFFVFVLEMSCYFRTLPHHYWL